MSDLAKWKVRGPVRTLRKEHAEWDPSQGTWQVPRGVSTVTFRHDGQVSEGEFHNPDGSVARWARVYDNDGRIIEEQSWRDDGPRSTVGYSYDALGRLAARGDVAPDGTRREAETCRYDGAGRKTKVTFLFRIKLTLRSVTESKERNRRMSPPKL
jgi:YD repeat-containing protein